ncbi:dihydroneopterin aldolase [Polynucleobacter sp. MWH-UH24A]|jgi:dihydroneopterin aldolase|uniref:dihydroneopterin aldolase n=1 Tax=Polynucleobacter sp. MWH-UH24A TaxID=2689110 RepID=UPI001BFE3192|nr:dihydroneopterin aldolase [Polynucleobacter sp. MWH-UH24A]QWD76061.1 dihydroneopterin aldolase [Polynucleobacter sp. MWH-UH24A]
MHSLLSHPSLINCRRLFLKDYEVYINIGVHDFEKRAEQRVIFNVEIYVPLELNTPKQDRLEEVLDYDFIRKTIVERVKRGHIHLQETLCDEIVAAILEHPNVMAVRVSTAKPDVYPDCEAVGVEVFKMKQP